MQLTREIHISDSLWRLIESRSGECNCLRFLIAARKAIGARVRYTTPARYMSYSRAARMLYRGHQESVQNPRQRSRLLATEFPGNYFSFREKSGLISYMPKGRTQEITPDGLWVRKGRQSMKPARWLRAMLNPRLARRIGDDELAEFTTIIKHEELRQKLDFKLVSTEDAYDKTNFTNFSSCMWNQPVGPFYNAFGAQALVAVGHDGMWRARAIVWPNVSLRRVGVAEEIVTVMDRVYSDTVEVSAAMREYADQKGWVRKNAQNRENGLMILPSGKAMSVTLTATTEQDLGRIEYFPYLDTLFFGKDNHSISNSCVTGHKYTYQEQHGGRAGDDRLIRDYHGRWINRADAITVQGMTFAADSPYVVQCVHLEEPILRSQAYRIEHPDGEFWIHRQFVRQGERM